MAELPAIKRRLLQQGVDLIDVGAGDADFPPPRVAVEALTQAIQDPAMSRYPFQIGLPAFRERSEEHTSELQSQSNLVCRLLLEKKKKKHKYDKAETA